MSDQNLIFAGFEFSARQRRLTRDGAPVRIGSRAFDILATLLANAGSVVTKEQLMSAVWPDTFVDEANLRVHVSALRKALDETSDAPIIENIPGRGYSIVAPVSVVADVQETVPPIREIRSNLPFTAVRPIGREDFIRLVVEQLAGSRLITVTGPGGMGKTTTALAAAHRVASDYLDGVVFVDFSTVAEVSGVQQTLLSAVELVFGAAGPAHDAAGLLRTKRVLLVLDNCEHLIEAVADLVMRLMQACPHVQILATSREPLRVPSEWVQRLPPLDVPPECASISAREAAEFSSVKLFLERVSESVGGYELQDADAPLVVDICRRLDGIALAIELAAGRIGSFGLQGLADALDDLFRVLRQGRRTALPRHQTLRATLDWSYGILRDDEKRLLRRTAVFGGGFSGAAALAVLAEPGDDTIDLEDILAGLVAKSLVVADMSNRGARYRLLETTRSYCAEKLAEAGEVERMGERHAAYYTALFQQSAHEWDNNQREEWLKRYAPEIDNLRVALKWSLSSVGSSETLVALTVAAIPLWFQLSLLRERLLAAQRATEILDRQSQPDLRQRMKLNIVLGWPQLHAMSGVESGPAAWRTVLEIAEELGESDYQLRAQWALWVDRTNSGDHQAALKLAESFLQSSKAAVVAADDFLIGHRMMGRSLHMLGQQGSARERVEFMLQHYGDRAAQEHTVRFQYNQRASARSTLVRTLFVQGQRDDAMALAAAMVEDVLATKDAPSLCHVLSDSACLVALLSEEWTLADTYISLLREWSSQTAMDVWATCGEAYAAVATLEKRHSLPDLTQLEDAISILEAGGFLLHTALFRLKLALAMAAAGRTDEASGLIELEVARCSASSDNWLLPELMRARCDIAATNRGHYSQDDLPGLQQALELARDQGALEWELRVGLSMAKAHADIVGLEQGRLWAEALRASATSSTSRYTERLNAYAETGEQAFTTLY